MSGYSRVRMDPSHYPSQFIHVAAVITECFAGTAFHAVLPNGKVAVAFLERKNNHLRDQIKPGTRVDVCICPADFERARIDAVLDVPEKAE